MRLAELVATSSAVQGTAARRAKLQHLSSFLARLPPEEIEIGVNYLSGEIPGGRVQIGPALLQEARPAGFAELPSLELREVQERLRGLAELRGAGSKEARIRALRELLSRGTAAEADFLARLVLGELRQGALEGLMGEAVAAAAGLGAAEVRRAAMFAGEIAPVARAVLAEGASGLRRFGVQLFRPLLPMLAQPAEDLEELLEEWGEAALEYKLDGARVQVHRSGDEIAVFTRGMHDVTAAVPELVELGHRLPAHEVILDGEAVALGPGGRPRPFQVTMRRFGRKRDVAALRRELPLTPVFFDVLYAEGADLLDETTRRRREVLERLVQPEHRIARCVTASPEEARRFLAEALSRGHEGIMAKSLEAPYEAGRRGGSWCKIKPSHTLDLVVLAADWGHGRRKGFLSNLHLGAFDPAGPGFVMLGKTFKGMTDEILAWQTRRLLSLEVSRDAFTVFVRPELVVEVAANDLQRSPRYPGGLALRFARVKRYRPDKTAQDATTMDEVRRIAVPGSPGEEGPCDG